MLRISLPGGFEPQTMFTKVQRSNHLAIVTSKIMTKDTHDCHNDDHWDHCDHDHRDHFPIFEIFFLKSFFLNFNFEKYCDFFAYFENCGIF